MLLVLKTTLVTLCYTILVSGGVSIGCSGNAGAAGTYFNADLLSLRVGNDNLTTETETPLLDFSTSPLWSNVFVENNAKALVPLLWTRVQVLSDIFFLVLPLLCRSGKCFPPLYLQIFVD